ncbi:MAG: hypothetical protein KJ850_05585 [Gammaproteobacteria bacterium]|nr:hypothetical protein [Gammaproteobacteria bacterium]MBU1624504.1 hypothetical protein [Gammaproteobacteria bacterium]MBU1982348.1 hypothetical protein [Gammaproteobacteria bacterium]
MNRGDVVKFKKVIDAGDEELRMVVLEGDGERVLVQTLVGMRLNPTYRYNIQDLEICSAEDSSQLH